MRFNKSIKLGKFLKINISKSGISATLGKKGASVNIGSKGTYLNLSPALAGLTGTGVSYRKKIANGYANNKKKKTKKAEKTEEYENTAVENYEQENQLIDNSVIDEYNQNLEAKINIHKYTDDVMNKEEFAAHVENLQSEASKEMYRYSIEGDEDTIENLVSSFMNNLALAYEARVNYELEGNILYVDLDLPEIEDMDNEYPVIVKNKISYKKKTSSAMKEEYAKIVMSLGVFLTANYFNLSSYIDEVVISAFTTARNNEGDLVDQYLYSVKYTRDIFEKTRLADVDDLYAFMLNFENRINMSASYTFKAIKPYEMESVKLANSLIDDAVLGLKELGYKSAEINEILPKLSEYSYESSSDYLKEGLRLLKENSH